MSDYFVFGDVDSRNYSGVHVFNKSVDNTPKRVYEVKNIAGRNGAFYVDQGRYEDVEHSYGVVALTKSAGSNFINALVSQVGYRRLSDSFNEDEFYLATLTDAVEAKVSKSTRDVNTFDITFTRKPQRFLKSGETELYPHSGYPFTNPTLFESHPLLKVWGYGDIAINGETITISDDVVGDIIISPQSSVSMSFRKWYIPSATNKFRSGDKMRLGNTTITLKLNFSSTASSTYGELEPDSGDIFVRPAAINDETIVVDTTAQTVTLTLSTKKQLSFLASGGGNFFVGNVKFGVSRVDPNGMGDSTTYETNLSLSLVYGTDENGMYLRPSTDIVSADEGMYSGKIDATIAYGEIRGYSTKSALGEPLYFDLDIGEAYKEEDGMIISVNNAVSFPAQLPVLKSGANIITYENTVDQLRIVPRWWKV